MFRVWCVFFVILMCLTAYGQAADNSIFSNGTFDVDVSDWTPAVDATIEWSPMNADFEPDSGSALVTNTASYSTTMGARQCADLLEADREYLLRSMIFIPSGQVETGSVYVSIRLFDQPNCQGTVLFADISSQVYTTTADQWLESRLVVEAPANAQSALAWLSITKNEGANSLGAHFDNVSFEMVDRHLSYIPAAGFAPGDAGSFWVTDLDVNNPGNQAMTYYLWWLPRGEDNSEPMVSELFTLGAEQSKRHKNVLGEVFDLDPGDAPFGALAIASDGEGALAMARVFNQSQGSGVGTFGQAIPGVPARVMIRQGERRRILFMSEDDELRANVGCQNGTAANLRVMIELFDVSGESHGLETLDLPPYSNNQINRIFRDWAPISGYVDVWSTTSRASFYCYGSVLDNVSSDPTTVLPQ